MGVVEGQVANECKRRPGLARRLDQQNAVGVALAVAELRTPGAAGRAWRRQPRRVMNTPSERLVQLHGACWRVGGGAMTTCTAPALPAHGPVP
jgi:hypothetical protein